ncbi:MAG: PorT family protein [Acidimicrobiia bacterium]|nr:PorT family protein [Acidimicrobiia bacterium]
MKKTILVLALAAPCLFGQAISWGVRAGVPITDAFATARSATRGFDQIPNRYTIGPTLEVRLPFRLGVSFDILYKKLEYDRTDAGVTRNVSVTQLEFPLLFKYRFGDGAVRPWLGAGPTFNRISGLSVRDPIEFVKRSSGGIAFGAGVELKALLVRINPELRVTHRGSENFSDPVGALLKSRVNQAEFLIGLTF